MKLFGTGETKTGREETFPLPFAFTCCVFKNTRKKTKGKGDCKTVVFGRGKKCAPAVAMVAAPFVLFFVAFFLLG